MSERRSAFLAEHKRPPTPDEAQAIREAEREDRRQEAAARREGELRLAYLAANPGAGEDDWRREKSGILAEDRKQATLVAKDAASAAHFAAVTSKF